ncbi:MAG: hypothetical protein M3Q76_00230, partial [Acidobacteriota bacterium]|nr:hypothetical protein [Acidobacteriota bacterium]
MSNHIPCPACSSPNVKKLMYTARGGILWTPFLNFAKCRACGARFHGQTGQLDPPVPKAMRVVSVLIIMGFVGLIIGFALALSARGQATQLRLVTREVSLGQPHAGEIKYSREFSPDGLHVAYSVKTAEGEFVVVDGVAGKTYTGIPRYPLTEAGIKSQIVFSLDGRRVAYVAQRGAKFLVVVDAKEGPEFDNIRVGAPSFSPDGRRVAYTAERGDSEFAIVDGVESKLFDSIYAPPQFSPDSKRVAYVGERARKMFMVIDGVESPGKEYVSGPDFSPDGGRVAYKVSQNDKWQVITDGKESRAYDGLGNNLVFSADGRSLLYRASLGGDQFVVVNNVEGHKHPTIEENSYTLSPDGKRAAYKVWRNRRQL